MEWYELFPKEQEPSNEQVKEYVESPLWEELSQHLAERYGVQPQLSYSGCKMDNCSWLGWNVKYKKKGRALCTLYPKAGYFRVLLPIGHREMEEAELLIPLCSKETQKIFNETAKGYHGKSLAFEVENQETLVDLKQLIALRAG